MSQARQKELIKEAVKRDQTYHKKLASQVACDSGHRNQNFQRKFDVPAELQPSDAVLLFDRAQSEWYLHYLSSYLSYMSLVLRSESAVPQ